MNKNISNGWIQYLPQESFIPKSIKVKTALAHYDVLTEVLIKTFPHFSSKLNDSIRELSGGEVRLLEIFIILKSKNLFCILDEPFSNLMPLYIEKVLELIENSKAEKGIIITDHLYSYLLKASDRLYFLQNGKTFPIKNPEELISFGYLPHKK